MSREYYFVVFFVSALCLESLQEVGGQSTADESAVCESNLPTWQQVANLIQKVEKVISSNQEQRPMPTCVPCSNQQASTTTSTSGPPRQPQQPSCTPSSANVPKHALVSALQTNCVPLLIQQNVGRTCAFNRSWAEFKHGFNDTKGDYWLGNDLLHELTKTRRYKLRCLLWRSSSTILQAKYHIFLVGPESTNYTLTVAQYSGNANDYLKEHNGMMFVTYDRSPYGANCAQSYGGGFWNNCIRVGVNNCGNAFKWGWGNSRDRLTAASMWLIC